MSPDQKSYSDSQVLGYIHREFLGMFWSGEKVTVANVLMNINKWQHMSKLLNLKPIELSRGPWTIKDKKGFHVTIEMLRASQEMRHNFAAYV